MTAKLQTLADLEMDPQEFYELALVAAGRRSSPITRGSQRSARTPRTARRWRGSCGPATYRVLPDTTPEELVRLMLDQFAANVGQERLDVPGDRGLTFYQVHGPGLDRGARGHPRRRATADRRRLPEPDRRDRGRHDASAQCRPDRLLRDRHARARRAAVRQLAGILVLEPAGRAACRRRAVPEALQGFQTYQTPGLIPWPICTPSLASIDAALEPDTADAYIYFLAIPDGDGAHAFAKTKAEHDENRRKYGYIQ